MKRHGHQLSKNWVDNYMAFFFFCLWHRRHDSRRDDAGGCRVRSWGRFLKRAEHSANRKPQISKEQPTDREVTNRMAETTGTRTDMNINSCHLLPRRYFLLRPHNSRTVRLRGEEILPSSLIT